jgi:spore germination protein GerM
MKALSKQSLQFFHSLVFLALSFCITSCSLNQVKLTEAEIQENSYGVYFLKIHKTFFEADVLPELVSRERNTDEPKLKQAIQTLVDGPTQQERARGITTEIPKGTRLQSVEYQADKIVVELTEAFVSGGGSRSMLTRYKQLERTILLNSQDDEKKRPVYVQVEGKPLQRIGGEGLLVNEAVYQK